MLKNYIKIKAYKNGDKFYLNMKGKEHRLDGPAVEKWNGSKEWYINGNTHRNIDPSIEWSDGEKYWFFINKRHRIGGSYISCSKLWCVKGKSYTKQDYFNEVWDI